jgi:excisionase family DNA binding protein
MKSFKKFLSKQLRELDEIDAIYFEIDNPSETIAWMMEQISLRAGKLGLPELVVRDISTIHDARVYIARCLQACPACPSDLLTVKDAAQKLNISTNKLYDLCKTNQIIYQKIGRSIRIRPDDLIIKSPKGFKHL